LRIRQGLVDQYASFQEILDDPKAWMMAHLSHASGGALEAAMQYGRPYMKDNAVTVDTETQSLSELLQPLGSELDRFLEWIAGNRAERLKAQDKERLFSDVNIEALKSLNQGQMADGKDRAEVYEAVRKEFEGMNNAIVKIGVDTGLISKEEANIWKEQGFYVPFYRMLEEEGVRGPQTLGKKGLVRQEAYKKLKGADLPLNDLLSNVLLNWNHVLDASLKNQAAVEALSAAEKMGLAESVNESAKGNKAVYVRIDGEKVWYDLDQSKDGQLVLESLSSLNYNGLNNFAMRMMRKVKRALTIGVTASPEFRIANLLRDSIHSIAVVDVDANIVKNIVRGWKGTKKSGKTKAQMIAGGGAFGDSGYIHGSDPEAIRHLVNKGVSRETILDGRRFIRKMWDKWEDFGARMENVNRAAAFEKKLRDGSSLLEANFEARDLLDFSRTGAWPAVRFLTQTVPFFNARLQGLDKLRRAAFDPRQRKRFYSTVAVYSLASVALYLMMKDDEDFKNAEEWERDTYHLFKIPGSDIMYRMPRPFEVGAIASMLERAVEQVVSDEVHGELFAERLWFALKETLAFNPMPQAFQPILEVYANKNSFTGRPIESLGMQLSNLSPTQRKRAWTSETAIGMSQVMDKVSWGKVVLSPVQIEHLVNGYFGWMGAQILGATDSLLTRPLSGAPEPPSKRMTDYPVLKRFLKEHPRRYTKYVSEFYERLEEVNSIYGDIKQMREFGEAEKALEMAEKEKNKLKARKYLNKVRRAMSDINKQITKIRLSRSMDPDEKRRRMDILQERKNKLAKAAVEKTEPR
jgi:hypothetical protein